MHEEIRYPLGTRSVKSLHVCFQRRIDQIVPEFIDHSVPLELFEDRPIDGMPKVSGDRLIDRFLALPQWRIVTPPIHEREDELHVGDVERDPRVELLDDIRNVSLWLPTGTHTHGIRSDIVYLAAGHTEEIGR